MSEYPGPYTADQASALLLMVSIRMPGFLEYYEDVLKKEGLWPDAEEYYASDEGIS